MTLAAAEHLAVLLFVTMLSLSLVALVVTAVRLRRAWRRRRRYALLRSLLRPGPLPLQAARVGAAMAGSVGSPSWWIAQRDRHGMWRSVAAARRAVSVASRAGAPVGDLPALARDLDRAAAGVDAALRAAGGDRRAARRVADDLLRIEAAAADIRAGAVDALAATTVDMESVRSAVAVEIEAVAAGVRAARAARVTAG